MHAQDHHGSLYAVTDNACILLVASFKSSLQPTQDQLGIIVHTKELEWLRQIGLVWPSSQHNLLQRRRGKERATSSRTVSWSCVDLTRLDLQYKTLDLPASVHFRPLRVLNTFNPSPLCPTSCSHSPHDAGSTDRGPGI